MLAGTGKNNVKGAIKDLPTDLKGGGKASETGNVLESRFLGRAPGGLSPTEKLLTESVAVQKQTIEEARKKQTQKNKEDRAMLNLDKTIQSRANRMSVIN